MPSKKDIPGSPEVERRTFLSKEIRADQEGEEDEAVTVISGYAAVYNEPSDELPFVEIFKPGVFKRSIEEDDVVILFNHNSDLPLGRKSAGTLTLEEDERGLKFKNTPPDTQVGRDLPILVRRGDVQGASIAFRVFEGGDDWDMLEDGVTLKRTITEAKLYDVSPATFPAYKQTEVDVRAKIEQLKQERKVTGSPWRRNLARLKMELIED